MEADRQQIKNKITQSIAKNQQLLTDKKYYEFAQKVKLLSHRRMQTSKFYEAQILLEMGLDKLVRNPQVEYSIAIQLLQQLTDLFAEHPELWDQQSQKLFYQLASVRQKNERIIKMFKQVCTKICDDDECVPFAGAIVEDAESRGKFIQVENYAVLLSFPRGLLFLKKWANKLESSRQKNSIYCRFALIKGLKGKEQQAQKYLEKAQESPERNFSRFLLFAAKMKSKKAFEKLGDEYRFLIDSDQSYHKLYSAYGAECFGLESSKKALSGLMSIMD